MSMMIGVRSAALETFDIVFPVIVQKLTKVSKPFAIIRLIISPLSLWFSRYHDSEAVPECVLSKRIVFVIKTSMLLIGTGKL
jgi:hypothetical protein